MKWHQAPKWPAPGENTLIAQFGEARLVRHLNASLQLRGGTETDRAHAHDWIVRYLRPCEGRGGAADFSLAEAAPNSGSNQQQRGVVPPKTTAPLPSKEAALGSSA